MSEKKTDAFTVHLPPDIKNQALGLARHDGLSLSEWALEVIEEYIRAKQAEYSLLKGVFERNGS